MRARLEKLQAERKKYPNGDALLSACTFDIDLQKEIKALYLHFFNLPLNANCKNCYFDAYLQLIKLSNMNCDYRLRAGVVLTDSGDVTKNCSNVNITNKLAEFHLKKNPQCVKYFEKMPEVKPIETNENKPIKKGRPSRK